MQRTINKYNADRNKFPMYLIPHWHNPVWATAHTPLMRQADNMSTYATQSPIYIQKYAEMRTHQKQRTPFHYGNVQGSMVM